MPAGLPVSALAETRARFLTGCGWAPYTHVLRELEAQNLALTGAESAVLWFERDLFDQLQLLQVLVQLDSAPVELVDLGEPTRRPDDLFALERVPIQPEQRALAARAWSAFRSPDPRGLAELAAGGTAVLPFLAPALERLLEELPAIENGLARSERELLEAVRDGASTPHEAFEEHQRREQRPFMGDTVFWRRIEGLARARVPLLAENGGLALTDAGSRVLSGELDHVRLNGIDRWLGGVHLSGDDAAWRWNRSRRRVERA